jgi:hypothetical protein
VPRAQYEQLLAEALVGTASFTSSGGG